jgi:signal transduction histidine kinase
MKKQNDGRILIRIRMATLHEQPAVSVEIIDNGPGMTPGVLSKIWDPFFTTKDQGEGSGLGLGIVQGIIEKHRGQIEVSSHAAEFAPEQDRGTRFVVTLPVRGPTEAQNAERRRL